MLTLDDDGKLRQKFRNKRVNARQEGIPFELSFEDLVSLMKRAGVCSSDWGFDAGKNYVLARHNDSGSYRIDNCRFITQRENMREQNDSPSQVAARRRNVKLAFKALQSNKEALKRREAKLKEHHAHRKVEAKRSAAERHTKMHQSYVDEKNSQFGSFWITNGSCNKKWRKYKGAIPEGFRKGRTFNGK